MRELSRQELREWGNNLGLKHGDMEGITAEGIYRMMRDTSGNEYDAGLADWDFDLTDAEMMLSLFQEE